MGKLMNLAKSVLSGILSVLLLFLILHIPFLLTITSDCVGKVKCKGDIHKYLNVIDSLIPSTAACCRRP